MIGAEPLMLNIQHMLLNWLRTLRKTPGTYSVLSQLYEYSRGYARRYEQALQQRQRTQVRGRWRRLNEAFTWGGAACAFVGCFVLLPCGSMFLWTWTTSMGTSDEWLAWGFIIGMLLLLGAGNIQIAAGVGRAMHYERTRRNWPYLLVLPLPRTTVLFGTVSHAFYPLLSQLALFWQIPTVIFGVGSSSNMLWAVVIIVLNVEWTQMQALAAVLGIWSGCRRAAQQDVLVPFLLGVALALVRAAGGWLALDWTSAPVTMRRAALAIGPLASIAVPGAQEKGLLVAVVYTLALELLVRAILASCLNQIGEL